MDQKVRDVMERQLAQMVRLVDDLMDVNRISRGKLELRRERLPPAAAVEQAVEVCRPLLQQHGHRLRVDLPDLPALRWGDPVRLAQIFGNLLTNACKCTPAAGEIALSAALAGPQVRVSIKDNGAGIPADQLEHIFEMFTQAGKTLERAQGGLGIGLMLVRQLVQMHGGTVLARSDGLGKGSEFTVLLPLGGPPQAPVRRASACAFVGKGDCTRKALQLAARH
ncbi:HAMP domain-containing histidine kinase [Comamonas antarctica]|uniref:histidine kinase n=2 Tax=Comamonas antarctica TaxID=2743470 RepID=A0A6N1XAE8_9BURK|nr:HAMP domain-containing histidine kinase [Comamonas antarctica]